VEALIYVFDASTQTTFKDDIKIYQQCLDNVQAFSRNAKVFCLVHKMDLLPAEAATKIFKQRELDIKQASLPFQPFVFPTSIWNESLYQAWSTIVSSFVPNVKVLEKNLLNFCAIAEADEAILFERSTFLVIASASRIAHKDEHRFEKISNIIKQFKLTCSKFQTHFKSIELKNSRYRGFVETLTPSTYVMLISHDPQIPPSATLVNINFARSHFEKFLEQQ